MKKINVFAGSEITTTIKNAIKQAETDGILEFDFNGITVRVAGDSDPNLIYRDWQRGMLRPSGPFTVEPYPALSLSRKDLDEDARLIRERDERAAKRQAEYKAEQFAKKEALEKLLTSELELSDKTKWQSFVETNSNPYGAGCVRYAEQWARVMQTKIEAGARLEDIAKESSFEANTEGITGFMYGAAVSMLSQCWVHGEQLRRWHNLTSQIGREGEKANASGGVLNPALLNISGK